MSLPYGFPRPPCHSSKNRWECRACAPLCVRSFPRAVVRGQRPRQNSPAFYASWRFYAWSSWAALAPASLRVFGYLLGTNRANTERANCPVVLDLCGRHDKCACGHRTMPPPIWRFPVASGAEQLLFGRLAGRERVRQLSWGCARGAGR
jgi:hypothetical protein